MYTKLLPDTNTFHIFLNKHMIYLNGVSSVFKDQLVYVNDLIQVLISKWYYIFYRWLRNWTILRVRKFRRLVYRKYSYTRYKEMKLRKTRSRYTPHWIFNVRYDMTDVRPNFEVDYFTLSAMFLYEPYLINLNS